MPKGSLIRWFFAGALALMIVVRQYFTWHMPKYAQAETGRILAVLVNYNKTVYVTPLERVLLYGSYVTLALATVGLVVAISKNRTGR